MRVREILASMEGAEKKRDRDGGYRARGTRGVKLSVSSGIEEKEGERRREGERGTREGCPMGMKRLAHPGGCSAR